MIKVEKELNKRESTQAIEKNKRNSKLVLRVFEKVNKMDLLEKLPMVRNDKRENIIYLQVLKRSLQNLLNNYIPINLTMYKKWTDFMKDEYYQN